MHAYTKKKSNSQRFFILPTSTYIIEALREKQIGSNVIYIDHHVSTYFLEKIYCISSISAELFMSNHDNNAQFFRWCFGPCMHTLSTN